MKLRELLNGVPVASCAVDLEMEIAGVSYDSRATQPGDLFVAMTGYATDGHKYIATALEKGAAAVLCQNLPEGEGPYIRTADSRRALAVIGANWFGHPAEEMTMIAVTGTCGKTTTTYLLKAILEQAKGAKVGLIGTNQNMIGQEIIPTERTTPESFELQALFARMYDAGCTHVVMEVSSHAITLERIGGIHYDVAAFTNLTEDHLDFHKTMDDYCDAKAELFRRCSKAVVNVADPSAPRMRAAAACPVLTTSVHGNADLRAEAVELHSDSIRFTAVCGESRADVSVPIPGRFTVYNTLTVLAAAMCLGVPLEAAAAAMADVRGVKGRIEVVPTPGVPYTVIIDYAHSPDGLENVLKSVRDFCKGRLISVFGCGGDRDPLKRPIMGGIGVKCADFAIITSDNPRTEAPMAIIEDILRGVTPELGEYTVIEDRRKAIRYAMDIAKKDDIIVLAGKGHETYQEIDGIKHHLDEREEVAAHLKELREENG